MKRREFLQAAGAAGATLGAAWPRCLLADGQPTDVLVNDVHSKLNATRVQAIRRPVSIDALPDLVRASKKEGRAISIAAARHAMGGQQFGARTILLDLRGLNRVLHFDRKKGEIEVEAGIEWPQLIKYLILAQSGQWPQCGIIQKQTGADRLSIGGALAANVHGRGLLRKPFIDDVISFTLIDADGNVHTCSRRENSELFSLAIGGYGLFGVIARVTLRLTRRLKLRREVKVIHINELMSAFNDRIDDGFLYGDFQFSTAAGHDEFLRQGIFSCYKPVDD
ncbi:MAG: FAD-dependent oxidoreductase, partial [Gammaproteobacteria bacterium]|nr:FAD-dependent oxidoreductase [Gammaproteobacteria bacterium]